MMKPSAAAEAEIDHVCLWSSCVELDSKLTVSILRVASSDRHSSFADSYGFSG